MLALSLLSAQEYAPAYAAPRSRRSAKAGELLRSDLAGKDVISTVSGSQLGIVADLLVDPARMAVCTLCMKQKAWLNVGQADSCLELGALQQVGDVVLVNQDAPWPRSYAQGSEGLLRSSVYTHSGVPLGKVCLLLVWAWQLMHAGCVSAAVQAATGQQLAYCLLMV